MVRATITNEIIGGGSCGANLALSRTVDVLRVTGEGADRAFASNAVHYRVLAWGQKYRAKRANLQSWDTCRHVSGTALRKLLIGRGGTFVKVSFCPKVPQER